MIHAKWLLAGLWLVGAAGVQAATQPVAGPCNDKGGMCIWREPLVSAPKGWERKQNASDRYRAVVFAPAGSNFGNAGAVIYAKAIPRQGNAPTLAAFMTQDLATFRAQYSKLGVQTGLALTDGDGQRLSAVRLSPMAASKAQWETTAYAQEGEYYLVFVLSARTKAAHDAAAPAFQQMLAGYHAKANARS